MYQPPENTMARMDWSSVSRQAEANWLQRLTVNGRRRDIGIGSANTITPSAECAIAAKKNWLHKWGQTP